VSVENNIEKQASSQFSRGRALPGPYYLFFMVVSFLAIILSFINIFKISIAGYVMPNLGYYAATTGFLLPLIFLIYPASKNTPKNSFPWYDIVFFVVSISLPIYVFIFAYEIDYLGWTVNPPPMGMILSIFFWIAILEGVRRAGGLVLAITVLVFSVYPLFAHLFPGIFMAKCYSINRVLGFHFFSIQSVFGLPIEVFCRLLVGYMIFAITLMETGAGRFFINFCFSILGKFRGGAAKVSILSSAFFATMSGSVIANVMSTGAVTIPTMKNLGYPGYYAAAIEACASKGGVLTPPVMGVTAFIMAQFIGVSYASVCIAASFPVLLYWISLFMQSDFYAARIGLQGLPQEQIPSFFKTLKEGWFYIIALVALIYYIFFQQVEAWAPYYATAILLILANIQRKHRLRIANWLNLIKSIGTILSELMAMLIGIGMIIGAISLAGTAHGICSSLIRIGGEHLILLLVIGAVTSFMLGIGLTMSACYIFLAMLLAPTLINLGINTMAAHLFLLYWGSVSYITPPVALAAYAAAGIAKANPLKTGIQAVKLGFVSLIVPFFFVYEPALVGQGNIIQIINALSTSIVGVILLCASFEGYLFFLKRINIPVRIIFMVAGIFMFHPNWITDIIGLGLLLVIVGLYFVRPATVSKQLPSIKNKTEVQLKRKIDIST